MTLEEETTPAESKSTTRRFILPVALVILLVGAIGFVASQAGLDKALVKQVVDHFAADLSASTENGPAKMTLTYDDIQLKGGFTNRFAVLINPAIKEVNQRDSSVTVYRTDEIELHPTSADLRSLRVEAAKPIKLFTSESATVPNFTITQKEAITVSVSPSKKDGKSFTDTLVTFPDAFLIDGNPEQATDEWNKISLTLAPGAELKRSIIEGGSNWTNLSDSSFTAKSIKIIPDAKPADTITIDAIDSTFSNTLNEQKLNVVKVTSNVGPIASSAEILPYGPLTATIDFSFIGPLEKSPEAFAQAQSNESSMKLDTFSIKGKDASIIATADFVSGANDVLPVGTANITINNLPFVLSELRNKQLIKPRDEQTLDAVIERITGKKIAETTDLTVDVKRVRDGAFQIGNTTFEEIMALVLKGALGGKLTMPEPAPVTEPAPAPVTEMPLDTSPAITPNAEEPAEEPAAEPATTPAPVKGKGDIVPDTQG